MEPPNDFSMAIRPTHEILVDGTKADAEMANINATTIFNDDFILSGFLFDQIYLFNLSLSSMMVSCSWLL